MKLERVITELPPTNQVRSVDTLVFKHQIYEDVRYGHLYIQLKDKRGMPYVMRLTNED